MIISRTWQMPNHNTFAIKPITQLINKYAKGVIIDPFANDSKLATITNDLDPQYDTDYHMDALDFLKMFKDESVDTVLYDPPYSPRQVSECYKNLGKTVNMQRFFRDFGCFIFMLINSIEAIFPYRAKITLKRAEKLIFLE